MKNLILIISLLASWASFACQLSIPESYVPIFLNPPVSGAYAKCDLKPNEKCHCVEAVNSHYAELVDNEVVDYVAWRQVQSCVDQADCDSKFVVLSCSEGVAIKNYEELSVYCAVNIMKIEGKKLVESASKKAAYQAAQAQKAALAAADALAAKAMECGKSVQRLLLIRNASKNLSTTQVKAMVSTYSPVKALLDTGSLNSAKEEIQAVVADGVLVTEADKVALVAHLDACKP